MKNQNQTAQMLILGGLLAWVLASGMVACNKTTVPSNNMESGSLKTDGMTVFSSTTIGDQPVILAIKNIALISGSNTGIYGTAINPAVYNQSVAFDLTINRETLSLSAPAMVGNYGGYGNAAGLNVVQMSSYFQVTSNSACYLYTCDEVILSVYIQSYQGTNKLIAVRKNIREDRIVNIKEYSTYKQINQLMQEL